MQTTALPQGSSASPTSWLRISILVAGYLVALLGCCYFFSFKMVYLYTAGCLMVFFASFGIPQTRMTWRSWLVAALGVIVIVGVLSLFGDARVRHWKPHPGGYIPAWFLCFYAVQQLRQIGHGRRPH